MTPRAETPNPTSWHEPLGLVGRVLLALWAVGILAMVVWGVVR